MLFVYGICLNLKFNFAQTKHRKLNCITTFLKLDCLVELQSEIEITCLSDEKKMLVEAVWQIGSMDLTDEYVVEDSVGGSDVFACLPESKLQPEMTPAQTVLLPQSEKSVYLPLGIEVSSPTQANTPGVIGWNSVPDLACHLHSCLLSISSTF